MNTDVFRGPHWLMGVVGLMLTGSLLLVPVNSRGSGGIVYQNGVAEARALVTGSNHKPIFVEYDANGHFVGTLNEEQTGKYAGATVMSYAEYATVLHNLVAIRSANPGAYVMHATDYNAKLAAGGFVINVPQADGTSSPSVVSTPPAQSSSKSVLVRSLANVVNPSLLPTSGMILFESSLDLTDATVSANRKHIGSKTKSLIISASGAVLYGSQYDIGFKTAYYPNATDPDNYTGSLGQTPLGPVIGASVETGLALAKSGTDSEGRFNLPLDIPPCPGFSQNYDYNVYLGIPLTNFNPQSPTPTRVQYFRSVTASVLCVGYGEAYSGGTLIGQVVGEDAAGISALTNGTGTTTLHIPVDILALDGAAQLANVTQDASGLTAGNGVVVANQTTYVAPSNPQPVTAATASQIDFNGDGIPDTLAPVPDNSGKSGVWFSDTPMASSTPDPNIERAQDYLPDFTDEGLLKTISPSDLANTDLYVFRVSNGALLIHQTGIPASDVDAALSQAYFQIVMPGPNSGNAIAASTSGGLLAWQSALGLSSAVRGKDVDAIRPGEPLEVVVINRATGYIGTLRTTASAAGLSAPIALQNIILGPPNLKLIVERVYKQETPTGTAQQLTHTVGYQGAANSNDVYVQLRSIWLDRDGTPLPDGIDGYTARLAYVVDNGGGQYSLQPGSGTSGSDHVSYFNIRPGSYIQMLKLHGATNAAGDLKPAHLYVQVTGEPTYVKASFDSATPDHTNPGGPAFSYRPRTYVPVRVAVFDEAATEAARNSAVYAGVDPATLPAVYQWPYRPEMAFSVLDLTKQQLTVSNQDKSQTTIDLTTPNADLSALFGSDVQSALLSYYLNQGNPDLLPAFGAAPEQFIFALGGDEQLATVNADGSVTFTHLGSFSDVTGSDLLSLSLYLNSDPSNILWQVELPGLHVYYKVADDLEEVNPVKLKGDPTPTYRLLGGMRLRLTYYTPEPIKGADYIWSIQPESGTFVSGHYSTKEFTWTDPKTDPASNPTDAPHQATVYWEPDVWTLSSDTAPDASDAFKGKLTVSYTDFNHNPQTIKQTFQVARRKLEPNAASPMQGSDVEMLENVLWHLGLSPQYGLPGYGGTRISSIKPKGGVTLAKSTAQYSTGHEYINILDKLNPDRRIGSLEKMVRRFQGRVFSPGFRTPDNSLKEQYAGEYPGDGVHPAYATGIVDNATLDKLRIQWNDYFQAYDAYNGPDDKQLAANAQNIQFYGWVTDAANGFDAIYPETKHDGIDVLRDGETAHRARADLIAAWIKHEADRGHWGFGDPQTPYRATVGGADEFGSTGFDQILEQYTYGQNGNCTSVHGKNIYDPKVNLNAYVSWLTNSDCGGSFLAAFQNPSAYNTPIYSNADAAKNGDPILRGYYRLGIDKDVAWIPETGAQTPDDYDRLTKAIMAYNRVTAPPMDSLPGFLIHYAAPQGTDQTQPQFAFNYAIAIMRETLPHGVGAVGTNGMVLRTYIWEGQCEKIGHPLLLTDSCSFR